MARHARGRLIAAIATGALVAASLAIGLPTPAYADDPVEGALTSGDSLFPNQGNGGYDALHYDVDLTVNVAVSSTNNAVATTTFPQASTSVRAVTTGAPLSSYAFDFQGSTGNLAAATLNVDSVTVDGVPATFSRIENTTTNNAVTDVHKLIVTPASPVSGEFTTVVTYSGTPVRHTDPDASAEGWNNTTDGATFVNQPVGSMTAFPNNNTPSDKATYTFTINAPSKLSTSATAVSANPGLKDAAVASNGELVSKTPSADGDRTTWVWNQAKPMASMLSLISIGRYDVYESDLTLASGRTLHEWTFIDPAISIQNQNATQATRAQMKSILNYLESRYGPYPGNSVGLVTDVVPSAINYALETQDRSFFPNSASRSTTIHELTHQWFGDGVSPGDWNDIWISEGTATYAENMTAFGSSGTSTNSNEASYYSSWNTSSGTSSLWTTPPAAMTNGSQLFGSQVYTRGSWTLEALRTAIGAPAFNQVMLEWQTRYQGSSRRTANFIALAEEISGRSLTAFFQPWLYGTTKAAWPARFNLSLTGPTAPVSPNDPVSYTLSSRNNGRVIQNGSVVTVDLTDVLDDATVGSLPANTSLDGNILTWNVPSTAVGATSSVTIPVTVSPGTNGATLRAVAQASTLGSTCVECTPSVVVGVNPVDPAPAPTISGTATVGLPLIADTTGWPAGTAFAYQWTVDNTPVPGATGPTYTPDVTTVGLPVRVQVTGSKGVASPVTTTSAPTTNVVRATQTGSTPVISGTPQFGKKLTVDVGAWEPGTYFTYQWAANGASVSAANGGTGPNFTPAVATQLGQAITVTVTGTKAGHNNVSKTSTATAAVIAGEFASSPTPAIPGTPRALTALTAVPGQWDDGTTLAYQWTVGSTNVGTNSATYTPTIAQIGQPVTVTVTGTKPGFPTTARTSEPTAPIAPAAQVLQPTPTISGSGKVDEVLTLQPGTWDAGTTQTYEWSADGVPIDGETALTYTPGPAMLGAAITATVTSTRTDYATVIKTTDPVTVVEAALTTTPTPTVAGTPQVGVTLTADAGAWDGGVTLSYLWTVGGLDRVTATGGTYTPVAGDEGEVVTVKVTGTKPGYASVTQESAPTAEVALGELALTPTPTITGTPKVGSLLTAVPGTWDGDTTFTYQWKVAGDDVAGATGATYAPVLADLGKVVSVEVTGSKPGYVPVTEESAPTAAVGNGAQGSTPTPTVSGTPKVGGTLTANAGLWDNGAALTYQWTVDGDDVSGATATTYTPVLGDLGEAVTVKVTGTRAGFDPVTRESAPTAAVGLGDLTTTPDPQVSGSAAQVGVQLTAFPGAWDDGVTLAYQWTADGDEIGGATTTTYTPKAAELGDVIAVEVTGSKPGYTSVTRTSPSTSAVQPGIQSATPTPTISGTPKVGLTLTANAGAWDSGVVLTYQWSADGVAIVGADEAAYTAAAGDDGRTLRVTVTGTRSGYTPVARTSAATSPVAQGTLASTPTPAISGLPVFGETLTALTGSWDPGTVLTYTWLVANTPVAGATGATYAIRPGDIGKRVVVVVTGAKPSYEPVTRTSPATATVAAVSFDKDLTAKIKGKAKVGTKLKAKIGRWPAGTVITYRWSVDGTVVSTTSTWKVTKAARGRQVQLKVTVSLPGYTSQTDTVRTAPVV